MIKTLHFFFLGLILIITNLALAQCPTAGCTTTISGADAGTYTLLGGDKLCLTSTANFTGTINMNGGTLENCASNPQTFSWGFVLGPTGIINNYGEFVVNATISLQDVEFYNYGSFTVNGLNNFNINGDSKCYNFGTLISGNHVRTATAGYLYNEGSINAAAQLKVNGTSGFSNVGGSVFAATIQSSFDFFNSGTIVLTTSFLSDGGTTTFDGGCMSTPSWTNASTLIGLACGTIEISDYSENNGAVSGNIAIVDATPPGAPPYVDVNTGSFGGSVQWTSCGCPETAGIEDCSNTVDDDDDDLIDDDDPDCWPYNDCMKISVDHTKVAGSTDLDNFPMLVDITDPKLRNTINGGAMVNLNGYDIRFKISCGQVLDHDIESYSESTGRLIVWVKIPVLSATTATNIEMEIGNTSVLTNSSSLTTWSSDYEAIWHLNDDFNDATSNGLDVTNNGSTDLSAQIADGQDFDGSNDDLYIGTTNLLKNESETTLSIWINSDDGMVDDHVLCVGSGRPAPTGSSRAQLAIVNDRPEMAGRTDDYEPFYRIRADNTITTNTWYHIVGTIDYTNDINKIYVNGVLQTGTTWVDSSPGSIAYTFAAVENTNSSNSGIGADDTGGGYEFNGTLDEPRILNKVLSADWILTEYNNQSSPNTFYSVVTCSCPATAPPLEICGNAIDDNSDGRTDEPYPSMVQENMLLWLKADAGFTGATWEDQSINNNDATVFGDPMQVANSMNFNPGINFDGDDHVEVNLPELVFDNGNHHAVIFCVYKPSTASTNIGVFGCHGGTSVISLYNNWLATGNGLFPPPGAFGIAPHLVSYVIDEENNVGVAANSSHYYHNGNSGTAFTFNETNAGSVNPIFHVGKSGSSGFSTYFQGDIQELIIYYEDDGNLSISDAERQKIEAYLGTKYGISISHDYTDSQ